MDSGVSFWVHKTFTSLHSLIQCLHGCQENKKIVHIGLNYYCRLASFQSFPATITECHGQVSNSPALDSGGPGFDSRPRRPAILIEVFYAFPQSLQAYDGIVPSIRSQPLPTKSFPIHHHSLIILHRHFVSSY
jgi:hypothetical protein